MKWCRDYQFTEALNRIWFSSDVRARAIAAVQRGFEARSMLCVCTNQNRFRRRNNINPILKVSLLNLFPFFSPVCRSLALAFACSLTLCRCYLCSAPLYFRVEFRLLWFYFYREIFLFIEVRRDMAAAKMHLCRKCHVQIMQFVVSACSMVFFPNLFLLLLPSLPFYFAVYNVVGCVCARARAH